MSEYSYPAKLYGTADDNALAHNLSRRIICGRTWFLEERMKVLYPTLHRALSTYLLGKTTPPKTIITELSSLIASGFLGRTQVEHYVGTLDCGLTYNKLTEEDANILCPETVGRSRSKDGIIEIQGLDGIYRPLSRTVDTSFETLVKSARVLLSLGNATMSSEKLVKSESEKVTISIYGTVPELNAMLSCVPVAMWEMMPGNLTLTLMRDHLRYITKPYVFTSRTYVAPHITSGYATVHCVLRAYEGQPCNCVNFERHSSVNALPDPILSCTAGGCPDATFCVDKLCLVYGDAQGSAGFKEMLKESGNLFLLDSSFKGRHYDCKSACYSDIVHKSSIPGSAVSYSTFGAYKNHLLSQFFSSYGVTIDPNYFTDSCFILQFSDPMCDHYVNRDAVSRPSCSCRLRVVGLRGYYSGLTFESSASSLAGQCESVYSQMYSVLPSVSSQNPLFLRITSRLFHLWPAIKNAYNACQRIYRTKYNSQAGNIFNDHKYWSIDLSSPPGVLILVHDRGIRIHMPLYATGTPGNSRLVSEDQVLLAIRVGCESVAPFPDTTPPILLSICRFLTEFEIFRKEVVWVSRSRFSDVFYFGVTLQELFINALQGGSMLYARRLF